MYCFANTNDLRISVRMSKEIVRLRFEISSAYQFNNDPSKAMSDKEKRPRGILLPHEV